jgi:mono/diheme cytochrome c family protein
MRVLYCLTVLAAAVALVGCGSGSNETAQTPTAPPVPGGPPAPGGPPMPGAPPGPAAAAVTDPAAGKIVFTANCQGCHGANGQGVGKGKPDFTNAAWQAKESDEELLNSIANGHHKMPAFKTKLSEQQRKNALAYVRTFAKK